MFAKMWKRGFLVMVVGMAVATLAGGPIRAQSNPNVVARGGAGIAPQNRQVNAILYDQYDNAGANALTAQNFETVYDAYDSFLADDFVVPVGKNWAINQVDVDGVYVGTPGGPAVSFNVFLHKHNAATGLPSNPPQKTRLNVPYTVIGASTFRIGPIPSPPTIRAGQAVRHWWVSVQANMDFAGGTTGQWFWTDRSVLSNDPSVFKNPGNGFGTGCTTWGNMNTCLAQTDPDLMFTIFGTQTP